MCVCKGGGAGQARGRIQESRVDLQGERRSQTQLLARKLGREAAPASNTGLMRQAQRPRPLEKPGICVHE